MQREENKLVKCEYLDTLFSCNGSNNQTVELSQLQITSIGLFSVTPYAYNDVICSRIIQLLYPIKPMEISILDLCACVGGDTIGFARRFGKVIAIELNRTNYEALRHNIEVYGFSNVKLYCGDSAKLGLEILSSQSLHVLYIDPPWGGKTYKRGSQITLESLQVGNRSIIQWIELAQQLHPSIFIVCKVPRYNFAMTNFNLDHEKLEFQSFMILFIKSKNPYKRSASVIEQHIKLEPSSVKRPAQSALALRNISEPALTLQNALPSIKSDTQIHFCMQENPTALIALLIKMLRPYQFTKTQLDTFMWGKFLENSPVSKFIDKLSDTMIYGELNRLLLQQQGQSHGSMNNSTQEFSPRTRALQKANQILELLKQLQQLPDSILDFGGYDGLICECLSELLHISVANRYCADVKDWFGSEQAEKAKEMNYILLQESETSLFGLCDNSISLITCLQSLHHVRNLRSALEELARVCRPGGILVLREHDAAVNDSTIRVLIDIEHAIWERVIRKDPSQNPKKLDHVANPELHENNQPDEADQIFTSKYYGNYNSKFYWTDILKAYGFRYLNQIQDRQRKPMNVTRYYYAIYQKT